MKEVGVPQEAEEEGNKKWRRSLYLSVSYILSLSLSPVVG